MRLQRTLTWVFLDKIQCHVALTKYTYIYISPTFVSLESPPEQRFGCHGFKNLQMKHHQQKHVWKKWSPSSALHLCQKKGPLSPELIDSEFLEAEWLHSQHFFSSNHLGFPDVHFNGATGQTHALELRKFRESTTFDWKREKTLTETNDSPNKLGMISSNTNS